MLYTDNIKNSETIVNLQKAINKHTNGYESLFMQAYALGAEVWFLAMAEAGLNYFAWDYSPSTFSQMAAEKSVDMIMGQITVQFFTTVLEAEAWLATKPKD